MSKSPDSQDRVSDPAPIGGDTTRSDASATTLAGLREAISEIDQRHAEGDSGYLSGLSASDTSDPRSALERDGRPAAAHQAASDADDSALNDAPALSAASGLSDALSFDDAADDFDTSYAKAKKTAMNMLAMRDHASVELRDKLLKRDFLPAAVDELIAKLQRSRLLDDEEFAHRYVRAHRERRKLSRGALKRELTKKGLSADIISGAVDDVDGEEDLARQVAEKKAASSRGLAYEVRERRILGMLARRGFSSSVCLKVTREVLTED
ncbi:regulatory protein RecX [Brevibacterium marinum]|uniref:Regulatory protein RecX n=1 Tax=Brevibacterium marinum TaxID=418643 RepID=A0A846S1N2_9MICO|nr:regulatory protein RecX [Brevibacterium marinum]NJC56958.1 SOS response regulatory protein OraA/RecX [Brevibacterium marinum]